MAKPLDSLPTTAPESVVETVQQKGAFSTEDQRLIASGLEKIQGMKPETAGMLTSRLHKRFSHILDMTGLKKEDVPDSVAEEVLDEEIECVIGHQLSVYLQRSAFNDDQILKELRSISLENAFRFHNGRNMVEFRGKGVIQKTEDPRDTDPVNRYREAIRQKENWDRGLRERGQGAIEFVVDSHIKRGEIQPSQSSDVTDTIAAILNARNKFGAPVIEAPVESRDAEF